MKKIILSLGLISSTLFSFGQDCGCDHTVKPNALGQDIDANSFNGKKILAGDTVCVEAGNHSKYLRFLNLTGTAEKPIVIINCGGQVIIDGESKANYNGIDTRNSTNFIITGTGSESVFYGFKMQNVGMGLRLNSLTKNYEVDHIEVINALIHGIDLKNPPDCNEPLTDRKNGYKNDFMRVHDIHVDGSTYEGFYIGNSHYYTTVNKTCNGETVVFEEEPIIDAEIYNNIVENTGYDGIQVGSVIGQARIYNNQVKNFGIKNNEYDKAGYQINPGTKGVLYNNSAVNGTGTSYFILGDGVELYNNVSNHTESAIQFFERLISPESTMKIYNNTFLNIRKRAIDVISPKLEPTGFFQNNIIHINPENNANIEFYRPFYKFKWDSTKNILTTDLSKLNLKDVENGDFRPTAQSNILLNNASCAILTGRQTDAGGYTRTFGAGCDIGAFEYTTSSLKSNKESITFAPAETTSSGSSKVFEYTLTGSNLRSDIKAYTTQGFQISLDAKIFPTSDTLIIPLKNSRSISTTIYLRINPNKRVAKLEDNKINHISLENDTIRVDIKGDFRALLSSEAKTEIGFSIYPNPSKRGSEIIIEQKGIIDSKKRSIALFEISGKMIQEFEMIGSKTSITLPANLPKGIYLISLSNNSIIENTKAIIVE
jgi:hypothetical protein